MGDIVVTVQKSFTYAGAQGKRGLAAWAAEGDLPGETWTGSLWHFTCGGLKPVIERGERVYIVCDGRLRGYAPLVRIDDGVDRWRWSLVRAGGAVAVTIAEGIVVFRGWRRRWWQREREMPFPDWMKP